MNQDTEAYFLKGIPNIQITVPSEDKEHFFNWLKDLNLETIKLSSNEVNKWKSLTLYGWKNEEFRRKLIHFLNKTNG